MSMSLQEIFNIVWNGINSQGGPSVGRQHPRCKYRNAEGRKCAAGWLIPDELYDPRIETLALTGAFALDEVLRFVGIYEEFKRNLNHIGRLQAMHDNAVLLVRERGESHLDANFLEVWRQRMRGFAERNGLEVPGEEGGDNANKENK